MLFYALFTRLLPLSLCFCQFVLLCNSVVRDGFEVRIQLFPSTETVQDWDFAEVAEVAVHTLCGNSLSEELSQGVIFSHGAYGTTTYDNSMSCQLDLSATYPITFNVDFFSVESNYDRLFLSELEIVTTG